MYPVGQMMEEAALLAYYFHWTHDDIMELPHTDRVRWCREISKIKRRLRNDTEDIFDKL